MYTCKQIRNIVKSRLISEPRLEVLQDSDYFDLIKRGVKRCHRILVGVNYNYYKKMLAEYVIHSRLTEIIAFPSDLYKVISWKSNPSASFQESGFRANHEGYNQSLHWCEVDNGSHRGLIDMSRRKDAAGTEEQEGSLTYIREPDMPSNWASTPDVPDGYTDWIIQYVIAEAMLILGNPQIDMLRLKELDDTIIGMNRRGGAAGQTAAS